MNTPSHSGLHTHANDAIAAVQTALGTTGAPGPLLGAYVPVFNPLAYGAKWDGVTDDSAAIQSAANAALSAQGILALPSGTAVADNLTFGDGTHSLLVQGRGMGSRFPYAYGTRLLHKSGSANPLVTQEQGVEMVDFVLDGNSASGTVWVVNSFEPRATRVRAIFGTGYGLELIWADNLHFYDVHVDNCGSASLAAVRIQSNPTNGNSNTLNLDGLTIERSANTALDIASGTVSTTNYAEFFDIQGIHIESVADNGGTHNSSPLVIVGNARAVRFVAPFLYGGPGPLIQHNSATTWNSEPVSGLHIVGGELLGSTDLGQQPTNLVQLTAGDGFSMVSTRVDNCSGAAVAIGASYGAQVSIVAPVTTTRIGSLYSDARTGTRNSINPGPSSAPIIQTGGNAYQGIAATSISTFTFAAAGHLVATPFVVTAPITLAAIGIEVTTAVAATTVRLGIYADNNGMPGAVILDAGTVSAAATGWQETATSQTLAPGVYWLAAVGQGGTPAVRAQVPSHQIGSATVLNVSQSLLNGQQQFSITGALPNPWGAAANPDGNATPRVLVKVT